MSNKEILKEWRLIAKREQVVTRWRIQCSVCSRPRYWSEQNIERNLNLRPFCSMPCYAKLPNPQRHYSELRLEV